MSRIQRLLRAVLPARLADAMEAESRTWILRCDHCGEDRSVWDLGGVRWKAAGRPRLLRRCARCGRRSWQRMTRRAEQA